MTTEDTIFLLPEVSAVENNMRLDKFLTSKLPQVLPVDTVMSRSRLQKLISGGNLTLDEVIITDNSRKVKTGDAYILNVPPAEEADPVAENIALDIVYEDDDLLVVNKPAGMTVHPAAGAWHGTLVNALLYHCAENLSGIGGVKRPGIVHRIDKETSGLLVVAKNDFTHQNLSEQFAEHSIERTYWAVVYGVPQPLDGTIEGNIGRSPFDRKKMAIVQTGGKLAITHYKTLQIFGRAAALVQCNLETGRTHQIRVHLSSKGYALIGDKVYVKNHKSDIILPAEIKNYVNTFPRQALHAKSLGFIHPRRGQFMQFDSELPEDMQQLLQKLAQ
jgi:23S rRNA pseudouridine1911/1915/1917 synthase